MLDDFDCWECSLLIHQTSNELLARPKLGCNHGCKPHKLRHWPYNFGYLGVLKNRGPKKTMFCIFPTCYTYFRVQHVYKTFVWIKATSNVGCTSKNSTPDLVGDTCRNFLIFGRKITTMISTQRVRSSPWWVWLKHPNWQFQWGMWWLPRRIRGDFHTPLCILKRLRKLIHVAWQCLLISSPACIPCDLGDEDITKWQAAHKMNISKWILIYIYILACEWNMKVDIQGNNQYIWIFFRTNLIATSPNSWWLGNSPQLAWIILHSA